MSEPIKTKREVPHTPSPSEEGKPTKVTQYSKSSKAKWAIGAAIVVGVALVAIGGLSLLATHGAFSKVPQDFKYLQDLHQLTFVESTSLIGVPIAIGTGTGGVYLLYSSQKKRIPISELREIARKEALSTLKNDLLLLEDSKQMLVSIQNAFTFNLEELYRDQLTSVEELQKLLQKALKKGEQEELYRQLMLNFPSPKVLVALFALRRADQEEKIRIQRKNETFTITKLIENLESPLALLSSPLMLGKSFGEGAILSSYLERQKELKNLFSAIQSIRAAGESFGKPPRYRDSPKKIKEIYDLLASEAKKAALETRNLFEVMRSFGILTRSQGLILTELTLEQIADHLVRSDRFLLPIVNQKLLSPSSLMTIFTNQTEGTKIQLKDGSVYLRDIFALMVKKISDQGLSKENAIAAEQLYIHLMQLKEQLAVP